MKKRWFAASLAALMALSMTACGGGKASRDNSSTGRDQGRRDKSRGI